MKLTTQILTDGGFALIGPWQLDDAAPFKVSLQGKVPVEPGVYAHLVDGIACYVGSAQRGLSRRLVHYQSAKTLRTAARVRTCIYEALLRGQSAEAYAVVPPAGILSWNGLPVDAIVGIEEGLIRTYKPKWNRRGAGRQIVLVTDMEEDDAR